MDTQDLINTSAKALSPYLPPIVQSLVSFVTDLISERKQRRFEEFVQALRDDLKSVESQINQEFIQKDDFLDLFEFTSRAVVNERQQEKRHHYQRIFVTGIIKDSLAVDDVEQCIRLIDSMTARNIFVLRVLSDPGRRNSELGTPIKDQRNTFNTTTLGRELKKLFPEWSGGEILENIKDLEFSGLLQSISSDFQTMGSARGLSSIENHLTLKGERLAGYLRL